MTYDGLESLARRALRSLHTYERPAAVGRPFLSQTVFYPAVIYCTVKSVVAPAIVLAPLAEVAAEPPAALAPTW